MPTEVCAQSAAGGRLSIAIAALGGQGGGVLADWIVEVAECHGWRVQSTSVPGVAQRTGTTVYYLEMRPAAAEPGAEPIFALMPVPGDVDVVVAAELMEAGRAVARGLVTPERTTLIASNHRIYGITEKSAPGDGTADSDAVRVVLRTEARRLVLFDMQALCARTGSLISAVLCGALAASGALPFPRRLYEEAIRRGGIAVQASLAGFAAGFDQAASAAAVAQDVHASAAAPVSAAAAPSTEAGRRIEARLRKMFPAELHALVALGVDRLMDYQDGAYAQEYLDRLGEVVQWDRQSAGTARGYALSAAVARHLAQWMSYEDAIRVAQLKTRPERLQAIRTEVRAAPDQIVQVTEFLHPRFEDMCEIMPTALGTRLGGSPRVRRWLEPIFRRGRRIGTDKLAGFALMYFLAGLRRWRRGTLRHHQERERIDAWLGRIGRLAGCYELAVELAECQRLLKGYGETRERGLRSFEAIMRFVDEGGEADRQNLAVRVREMRSAALADGH